MYQTYLKDCDCSNGGIIIHDGIAVCRWCRKQYCKGGDINYEPQHFKLPLFRTHDGVDIFEGDEYWFINGGNNYDIYIRFAKSGHGNGGAWQYFSTEQAAKEYILMNKPCLSVSEILSYIDIGSLCAERLKELAKEKINQ
jgi:hypothetical protein